MRRIRAAFAAVLAIPGLLVISPVTASAASAPAVPAAPYNLLELDGGPGTSLMVEGQTLIDDNNTPGFTITPNGAGLTFTGPINPDTPDYWLYLQPPTGAQFQAATSYAVAGSADVTHASLAGAIGTSLSGTSGTLNVLEASYSGGSLTSFAATISFSNMGAPANPVKGELRFASTRPYIAGRSTVQQLFGEVPVGRHSSPKTITITGAGVTPDVLGTASLQNDPNGMFSITADTCSHATLAYGQTCTVSITAAPTQAESITASLVVPDQSFGGQRRSQLWATAVISTAGTYRPAGPLRILDTRKGLGASGAVGANKTINVKVAGAQGLPGSGMSAVVMNVTVTGATANSFLTVYPSGQARPTASNLNFVAGWTGANQVTVPIGPDGTVNFYNLTGSVHVIADVAGYYVTDGYPQIGYGYRPLAAPTRLLDTRSTHSLAAHEKITVMFDLGQFQYAGAAAVNITATGAQAPGFLTAWNGSPFAPEASTLNFTRGSTVANMATVPTGDCAFVFSDHSICGDHLHAAELTLQNFSSGPVDVIIDLMGEYDATQIPGGLRFRPVAPTRIVDSRTGLGLTSALAANTTGTVSVPAAIAGADSRALALNVTAVAPTKATYLTVWPSGSPRPTASNVNPAAGKTVPNSVAALLGGGAVNVYNAAGTTNVVVDVDGVFDHFAYAYPGVSGPDQTATVATTWIYRWP
ncbi:hypothetical protein [Hamadaea tsunoensis]|uniref:hypothetical protein n=1 Tax=Hamadaea tsunoensis TaxID=53368 RepID=UPI000410E9C7|nr:hypothetical protein [Hamadaea tsunoensis]